LVIVEKFYKDGYQGALTRLRLWGRIKAGDAKAAYALAKPALEEILKDESLDPNVLKAWTGLSKALCARDVEGHGVDKSANFKGPITEESWIKQAYSVVSERIKGKTKSLVPAVFAVALLFSPPTQTKAYGSTSLESAFGATVATETGNQDLGLGNPRGHENFLTTDLWGLGSVALLSKATDLTPQQMDDAVHKQYSELSKLSNQDKDNVLGQFDIYGADSSLDSVPPREKGDRIQDLANFAEQLSLIGMVNKGSQLWESDVVKAGRDKVASVSKDDLSSFIVEWFSGAGLVHKASPGAKAAYEKVSNISEKDVTDFLADWFTPYGIIENTTGMTMGEVSERVESSFREFLDMPSEQKKEFLEMFTFRGVINLVSTKLNDHIGSDNKGLGKKHQPVPLEELLSKKVIDEGLAAELISPQTSKVLNDVGVQKLEAFMKGGTVPAIVNEVEKAAVELQGQPIEGQGSQKSLKVGKVLKVTVVEPQMQ
jgi:hypothetical protein